MTWDTLLPLPERHADDASRKVAAEAEVEAVEDRELTAMLLLKCPRKPGHHDAKDVTCHPTLLRTHCGE